MSLHQRMERSERSQEMQSALMMQEMQSALDSAHAPVHDKHSLNDQVQLQVSKVVSDMSCDMLELRHPMTFS